MKKHLFILLALVFVILAQSCKTLQKSSVNKTFDYAEFAGVFEKKEKVIRVKSDTLINYNDYAKVRFYRVSDSIYILEYQLRRAPLQRKTEEFLRQVIKGKSQKPKRSMKGQVFKKIADKLKSKVTKLKRIDLDRSQIENEDSGIVTPAALVSFGESDFKTEASGVQRGETTIYIKVVQSNRAHNFQGVVNNVAIEMLDFANEIYLALQSFEAQNLFTPLDRVSASSEVTSEFLIERIGFKTFLTDISKQEQDALSVTIVGADPDITTTINL